jgi:cytochrome c
MLLQESTMTLLRRKLTLGFAASAFAATGHAADQATPDEAKALAERAAAHFKEVGAEQAIADFNRADGGYVDRELFVVVYDPDHKIVGSYGVPVLRNKDATTLKDVTGKEFGKEILALAQSQGSGWVEYRMTNPVTKKVGLKKSWVIGLGDYVLFVGAFES